MTPMATPNSERLLGVITDDDVAALSARNAQRARQAIMRMGQRWCCHRANSPVRYPPIQMRRSTDWPAERDHDDLPDALPKSLRLLRMDASVGEIQGVPIVPLPETLRRVLRGGGL